MEAEKPSVDEIISRARERVENAGNNVEVAEILAAKDAEKP